MSFPSFSSILGRLAGTGSNITGPTVPPVPGTSAVPQRGPDGVYRMPDGTPTTPPFLPNPSTQPGVAPGATPGAAPKSPLAQYTDPNVVLAAIAGMGRQQQQQQMQPPTKAQSVLQALFGGQIPQRPVNPADAQIAKDAGFLNDRKANGIVGASGVDSAGNPLPANITQAQGPIEEYDEEE